MVFNPQKKQRSRFNNLIKHFLFGSGLKERKIVFGRARGIKMLMDPAYRFQTMIGTYEYEIQHLFVTSSKKSHCFFDIGAGEAYYSLLYKRYNPHGTVYLFDMDKTLEGIQKENLTINSISGGIQQYFKSVSDMNDERHISADSFKMNNNTVLMKIDVEGAELQVLNGAETLLKSNNCFLLVETHALPLEKDCMAFLQQLGYHTKIIKNAWWRFILRERRPLLHNRWLAAWK